MCSELAQYYLRGPTFVQREPEDPDKLHANVTTMTFHICKSLAEHKETLSRKNDFISLKRSSSAKYANLT